MALTPTSKEYILTGRIGVQTGKAIQFTVSEINSVPLDEDTTQWFPFSQVSKIVNAAPDSEESDEIAVTRWILEQKDLI